MSFVKCPILSPHVANRNLAVSQNRANNCWKKYP